VISEIFIAYSWWTVIPVLGVGLLYAAILYFKNPLNKLSNSVSIFLAIFRFLVVSLLGFLLLSPTIRTRIKHIEKPIIVIGQDNSRSILMTKDSIFYSDTLPNEITNIITQLSKEKTVDSYIFGEEVIEGAVPDYTDDNSNYSSFITTLKQNYTGLNVGAVIIAGDGIFNNGTNPVYAAENLNFPIFTIALGDTLQSKDMRIDDVRYNSVAYLDDVFPIEVSISANKMADIKTNVTILENNKVIASRNISITSNTYQKTIKFSLEAKSPGKKRYSIIVNPIEGEISVENNNKSIFIDILNSRQKILLLAYAPHPDLGAIKQSLLKNKNYIVDIKYITGFNSEIANYDLVILHQLPSKRNPAIKLLKELTESKKPVLFIIGNQTNLVVFNKYYNGLNILSSVGNMVQAQYEYDNSFTFFSFDNELANQLSTLPPLNVPLGNYSLSSGAEIFGWQMISGIDTDLPLISFYNKIGVKSGVICGEGIWLWRIQNQLQYANSEAVDEFINKAAMFLIAESDKRHFKVYTKTNYNNNADVTLSAELYNQAFELDNTTEVGLTLTNEKGEKFNFAFSPYNNYYKLNLGKLQKGSYIYKASAKLGSDKYYESGEFIIQQPDNESRSLNANHNILYRLAAEHNGKMYYPESINELVNDISNLPGMSSKIHYEDKFTGLNQLIYLLIILLTLLSVEWFLRKYFGNY